MKIELRMIPVISDTKIVVAYNKYIGKTDPFNWKVVEDIANFWDLDPEEVHYLEKTIIEWLRDDDRVK